jgi:hypothetical protein
LNYIPEESVLIISKDGEKVDELREKQEESGVLVEEVSKRKDSNEIEANEKANFKQVGIDAEDEDAQWPIDDDILIETQEEQIVSQAQTAIPKGSWRKGENQVIKAAQLSLHIAD